jgi:NAD+ kinase
MADTATKHVDFDDDDAGSTDGLIEDGAKRVEVLLDPSNPHRRKSSLVESESQRARLGPECIVHQFFDQQQRRISHDAAASSVYHHEPAAGAPSTAQRQGEVADAAVTKTASELDLSHHTHGSEYQSRTLSKKQLSDMAWGVRELSRRLSSMRMRIHVKTIFLLTKIYDQELIPKTRELTRWLLDKDRETHYTVYVQDKLRGHKRFDAEGLIAEAAQSYGEGGAEQVRKRLRYWDEEMCASRPHTFDFVITLGGDGTVLYASWLFQRVVPPVLSFALGSLGFLTQLDFDDFAPTLNSALIKGVTVSLRLRFEGTVMRCQKKVGAPEVDEDGYVQRDLVEELVGEGKDDGTTHKPEGTFNILNEIVVDRGPNPSRSPFFPDLGVRY